ncbi:MAG: hypothetical protein AAGA85_19380 [Bacteroidota bacterium]
MRSFFVLFSSILLFASCEEDRVLQEEILADFIELNRALEVADLVACAGGDENGLLGSSALPTDVFFYPIQGATDFRYFEAENVADSSDLSKYRIKDLESEPLFNGYMAKFNNLPFTGERMGIVTYKTPGKLHVCTPIRLKTNNKPTEVNKDLIVVEENSTAPSFTWSDGLIKENVIYFHVISDAENNLISGTYTIEKNFTFYDLSNVVFNITDPNSTPTLQPNKDYRFTLMGVSEDNWVNLFAEVDFRTD